MFTCELVCCSDVINTNASNDSDKSDRTVVDVRKLLNVPCHTPALLHPHRVFRKLRSPVENPLQRLCSVLNPDPDHRVVENLQH